MIMLTSFSLVTLQLCYHLNPNDSQSVPSFPADLADPDESPNIYVTQPTTISYMVPFRPLATNSTVMQRKEVPRNEFLMEALPARDRPGTMAATVLKDIWYLRLSENVHGHSTPFQERLNASALLAAFILLHFVFSPYQPTSGENP
ncbi:hypothetical protein F5888DRAFT_1634312 [Russula emetica]|nr:hypothetical protein F5888DRAFT_1634312 [Russula emetica]